MDVIFIAFANKRQEFLGSLGDEDDGVYRLLSQRAGRDFKIHRDSYATLDSLVEFLRLYRDDIRLFLYSGHANRDLLVLEDQNAGAEGIAQLLGQCPRLQLVFMNGCSTGGQVQRLLEVGVPIVLSTSSPVNDSLAARFSIDFFGDLCRYRTVREAFDTAKGDILARRPGLDVDIRYRGIVFRCPPGDMWGLDVREEKKQILDWKLPYSTPVTSPDANENKPNELLLASLTEGLAPYDEKINDFWQKEQHNQPVKLAEKRMAILNALPAPLSYHLQKMLAPSVDNREEGFNSISEVRLKQTAKVFTVLMELTAFTLLSQLWECFNKEIKLACRRAQVDRIKDFFRTGQKERETFDFLPLVRAIQEVFDQNKVEYFIEELALLKNLIRDDRAFEKSYAFLQNLRVRTFARNMETQEIPVLCYFAEQSLAYLLANTSFLAKYQLTSVQGIDVLKYRHLKKTRFNHKTVLLRDILGDLEESDIDLEAPMYNRSVLMIDPGKENYLNLSPFIIDENAFRERTDISKLFFFSHFEQGPGAYTFKHAAKPEDPCFEVSSAGPLKIIWQQFEAFENLLTNQTEILP